MYGFKEVCLKKNKKALSYLTKFFQGDLAEDKTVKNLEIDAESIHFDFNLVSALNFQLKQPVQNLPLISEFIRHALTKPKTNYNNRLMLNCVP